MGSRIKLGRNAVVAHEVRKPVGRKFGQYNGNESMRSISSLPRGLYSTQTVRAAPREAQAAAEVTLDSD